MQRMLHRPPDTVSHLTAGPASRRRPGLAIAGATLVLVCAVFGAEILSRASHRTTVLMLSRRIPVGAVLQRSDFRSVSIVPSAGLQPVPRSDEASITGKVAAVTLLPGSLLMPADTAMTSPLATQSLVGTELSSNEAPIGLEPGDPVAVVLTEGNSANFGIGATSSNGSSQAGGRQGPSGLQPILLARATVFAVAGDTFGTASSTSIEVTIAVPPAAAASVALASSAGDVSLVELSEGAVR